MTEATRAVAQCNVRLRTGHRILIAVGVIAGLALLVVAGVGCQSVGEQKHSFDRGGATLEKPSPVTLDIQDNDKRGTVTGLGPARWTSITEGEVQTFQSGSTPRDMWVKKTPDGAVQFNLSSGTDVSAKGVEFDAASGSFKLGELNLSATAPLEVSVAALDQWRQRLINLDQAERDVAIKQAEAFADTIQAAMPEVAAIIRTAITGL